MQRLVMAVTLVLAIAFLATAENFAAPPVAPPIAGSPPATICSTDWGWCPLQVVVPPGGACYCFVPPSTWLPGLARYWPYEGPVSPYLNPHTAPPSTLK